MTNADKYLKDGVKDEFIKEVNNEMDLYGGQFNVEKFLSYEIKPTLTEDEKVILRNTNKKYTKIGRNNGDRTLYMQDGEEDYYERIFLYAFDHIFQFIQPRRRI